jgi:hypothetical protein
MSKHLSQPFRENKMHLGSIKDFNHSVEVKRFSRERNSNMTPAHLQSNSMYKKIQQRSN